VDFFIVNLILPVSLPINFSRHRDRHHIFSDIFEFAANCSEFAPTFRVRPQFSSSLHIFLFKRNRCGVSIWFNFKSLHLSSWFLNVWLLEFAPTFSYSHVHKWGKVSCWMHTILLVHSKFIIYFMWLFWSPEISFDDNQRQAHMTPMACNRSICFCL